MYAISPLEDWLWELLSNTNVDNFQGERWRSWLPLLLDDWLILFVLLCLCSGLATMHWSNLLYPIAVVAGLPTLIVGHCFATLPSSWDLLSSAFRWENMRIAELPVLASFVWIILSSIEHVASTFRYSAPELLQLHFCHSELPSVLLSDKDIIYIPHHKYAHRGSWWSYNIDDSSTIRTFWSSKSHPKRKTSRSVDHSVLAIPSRSATTGSQSDILSFGLWNLRSTICFTINSLIINLTFFAYLRLGSIKMILCILISLHLRDMFTPASPACLVMVEVLQSYTTRSGKCCV